MTDGFVRFMTAHTQEFFNTLFALPEVRDVSMKGIAVSDAQDAWAIEKGVGACLHDRLSDVDIAIALRVHPQDLAEARGLYEGRLSRLGFAAEAVLGAQFHRDVRGRNQTLRVCLRDGFRMDCVFAAGEDEAAARIDTPRRKEEESDPFYFIAVQALYKLLRGDHLIGAHLAHALLSDTLVEQMIRRDEERGTIFHRYGYAETLAYREVDLAPYADLWRDHADETHRAVAQTLCRALLAYGQVARTPEKQIERAGKNADFFAVWRGQIGADS
jgi:hypothetical protein